MNIMAKYSMYLWRFCNINGHGILTPITVSWFTLLHRPVDRPRMPCSNFLGNSNNVILNPAGAHRIRNAGDHGTANPSISSGQKAGFSPTMRALFHQIILENIVATGNLLLYIIVIIGALKGSPGHVNNCGAKTHEYSQRLYPPEVGSSCWQ
jgi:hypothetical protein